MKILLMGFSKIKYMPYLRLYLENIDSQKNTVHVLYWNRDMKNEFIDNKGSVKFIEFTRCQQDNVSVIAKIPNFLRYRFVAKKLIIKEKYDFIIILHTFPGVLLFNTLINKYRKKYIFDYRDSTYEKYKLFKMIIHKLVQYSYATFVSSDGFRKLLPKDELSKIYTTHNISIESLEHRNDKKIYGIESDKIRISYWGFIRDERINRIIMKIFSNDERFELHYYGREDCLTDRLKIYVEELNACNIFFHGEYIPEDRYQFIHTTDIIHNVFNDNNMMLAMSNRFYDGLTFRIPQICMKGSLMGELIEQSGLGIAIDPNDCNCADKVYEYFKQLNSDVFEATCDIKLLRFIEEYQHVCQIVQNITL